MPCVNKWAKVSVNIRNKMQIMYFLFSQKNNWLYQVSVGQCLAVVDPLSIKGYVTMAICDDSRSQQWQLDGWRCWKCEEQLQPPSGWGLNCTAAVLSAQKWTKDPWQSRSLWQDVLRACNENELNFQFQPWSEAFLTHILYSETTIFREYFKNRVYSSICTF